MAKPCLKHKFSSQTTTVMFSSQIGIIICCLLLWQTPVTLQQDDSTPVVETQLGKIQGSLMTSQYGKQIYAFRGIPYAQPPIGNLRFAAPQPATAWSDTFKATEDSLICPQASKPSMIMSEDCLKLNVFSGDLSGNAPVMVWIHGGANRVGTGHSLYHAGPQYLLDHEVVFVALNYRLGALGFMSTQSKEAPGNFAFLDQVLALKWVHDHISNFGGNPNLVTIFGVSAGSMAVTLHMASPLSKGLFHRAIAMSGSATNHYAIDNLYWTRKLARETSCPMFNPRDVVECLRELSWETIVDVCSKWETHEFGNVKWNYEIDGHFLEEHPTEIFRTGKYNSVPLLIGFAKDELDFVADHQVNNTGLLNDISLNFDKYAPSLFVYNASLETNDPPVSQRIQKFYLGYSGNITRESIRNFGEIFSDRMGYPLRRLVNLLLSHSDTQVFYYRFDYQGQNGLYLDANGVPKGVGHGDDVLYLMPGSWYVPQLPADHPDIFMVDRITKWWTTFAKNGDPYSDQYEGPWATANQGAIYIDRQTTLANAPFEERYAFWEETFPYEPSSATTIRLQMYLVLIASVVLMLQVIY